MTTTVDDIAVELGRPTPSTTDIAFSQWNKWIDRTRSMIKHRLGDLSDLDQHVLDDVVTQTVAEYVKRPDEATQVDTQIDDARVSRRYEKSAGRLVIRDEWWELLVPGSTKTGAFTVLSYGEPDYLWVLSDTELLLGPVTRVSGSE